MLLILELLLLFLTQNVNAHGPKEPLPRELGLVFQELIKMQVKSLVWNEDLANEALDILMRRYSKDFSYDLTITAREYFLKSDKSTLEEKLRHTLIYTFHKRRFELRHLLNSTQYGCNGITITYTRYKLMSILCLFKTPIDLPATMKETFEKLNSEYNKGLVWSEDLASEALQETKSRPTHEHYFKLRAMMAFRKTDPRTLEEKVLITFRATFARKGDVVRHLPNGTLYGCDGIFNTKRMHNDLMSLLCLYNKN